MSQFIESTRAAWRQYRRSATPRLTQQDAAKAIGVHHNTMCRWELGKATLPEPAFNRVISILASNGITITKQEPSIEITWVNCPECNTRTPALIGHQKFHHCAACGEALGKLCPNTECHHLNRFQAKYCESCGSPLETHNTNYVILKNSPIPIAAEDNGTTKRPKK